MKIPRLRRLFRLDRFGRRMDDTLEDEVRFHLETRAEQFRRSGLSAEDARRAARRGFGDPDSVMEECRRIDRRGVVRRARAELMADFVQDIRVAGRGLARSRGFTFVALISLTVGIGMNTAAFTAIDAIWFQPVPGVTGQDRIAELVVVDRGFEYSAWTYPDFEEIRAAQTPLAMVAGWAERDMTLGAEEGGRRVRTAFATANYFRVFGAVPPLGRDFLATEDAGPGQHPVAVVSHDLWQEAFGGDPNVVGRNISLNRQPYTIVGVAPRDFRGPRPNLGTTHLWVPLVQHPVFTADDDVLRDRATFWISAMGRLPAGGTRDEAASAVRTIFSRLASAYPEENGERAVKVAGYGRFPAQNRIWDMLAVGALVAMLVVVLLIICANLAGMALARAAAREQETAVRLALGSGRIRLVRLLMLEALLLAVAGGTLGILAATTVMGTVSPATFGVVAPGVGFEVSAGIVTASLLLTLLAVLAFGLLPAIRFSRPELISSLRDDVGGGRRYAGRVQRFAASAQVWVAVTGLVVGGLAFRSLDALDAEDLGFRPDGLVVTDFRTVELSSPLMDLASEGYPSLEEGGAALLDDLTEALSGVPGISAVAFADGVPLDGRRGWTNVSRGDLPDESGGRIQADFVRVGERYMEALGATLVRGRDMEATDDAASDPVVVITQSMAERLWPGEDPIGRTVSRAINSETRRTATVVGVVADVPSSRAADRLPTLFVPLRQEYRARLQLVLRTDAALGALSGPIREAIRSVDAALPQPRLVPAGQLIERSTQEQRGAAHIGGGLGLMVLLLSALGVYGVVAMTVAHRTREIGLRIAVGASRAEVMTTVLGDAVRLAAPGLLGGIVTAIAVGSLMGSMLLGVSPMDPAVLLTAAGILLAVVLLAGFVPARRASGIDPMKALRTD